MLTRNLGRNLGRAYGVRPDLQELALRPGDRLLFCSDGLYGGAPMAAIRRALGARAAPERIARQLVTRVLQGAAFDNVVIAVDSERARAAALARPSSRAPARRSRPSEPREGAPVTRPRRGPGTASARTTRTAAANRTTPGESRRRPTRASRPGLPRRARRADP